MSGRLLKTPRQRVIDLLLTPLHAVLFVWLLFYVPVRTLVAQGVLALTGYRPVRDASSSEFDVICVSHVPWRHIWQRNHHTMTRLAAKRRVVYLQMFGPAYIHVFARWAPGIFLDWAARHDRVMVRMPLLYPGESRFRSVKRLNRWLLSVYLKWIEWHLGMRNTVMWFYYPGAVYSLDSFEPAAVVYDIQDEYSAFYWAPRDIAKRERKLLRQADVMFAGTHALYEKKRPMSEAPCYFFPCGVEFEHFQAAVPGGPFSNEEPPELEGARRPRLFYMGLIDARIDGDLIREVARLEPGWEIVMAGPVDRAHFDDEAITRECPNVRFLGKIDYGRLPRLMARSDIFIMPWKINELTLHINPTKTLEYLAAARPVVSISLPDLETFFGETIALVRTAEEWVAACREALEGKAEERVRLGVEVARSYSWEVVVGQMEGHVRSAMARRAGNAAAAETGHAEAYQAEAVDEGRYVVFESGDGSHWGHCPPEARPAHPLWRGMYALVALAALPLAVIVMLATLAAVPVASFFEQPRRRK